jgi:hypothetical protein
MIYLQHTGYWINTAHILYITKLHGWSACTYEIRLVNDVHIQVKTEDEQTLRINGLIPTT